jgi:hypothetical protein
MKDKNMAVLGIGTAQALGFCLKNRNDNLKKRGRRPKKKWKTTKKNVKKMEDDQKK